MGSVKKYTWGINDISNDLRNISHHYYKKVLREAKKKAIRRDIVYKNRYRMEYPFISDGGGNHALAIYLPNGHRTSSQIYAAYSSVNSSSSPFSNIPVRYHKGTNNVSKNLDGYIGSYISIPRSSIFTVIETDKKRGIGTGSYRDNDTEYKILERIRVDYGLTEKSKGKLHLYTYFEPCLSCDLVFSQFAKLYPDINVNVYFEKVYTDYDGWWIL